MEDSAPGTNATSDEADSLPLSGGEPESTQNTTESGDHLSIPTVLSIFKTSEQMTEHQYGEDVHALLKNRPPEARYGIGVGELDEPPTEAYIHFPDGYEHAFVVLETESYGQAAFSGEFGSVMTMLLRVHRMGIEIRAEEVPPELPDFE